MSRTWPTLTCPLNRQHPLARGLVGWWKAVPDSRGPFWYDLSGYRRHGTLNNMSPATDWVGTGRGVALDFDGSNDYVTAVHPPEPTNAMTVMLWEKTASTDNKYFASHWDGSANNRGWTAALAQTAWGGGVTGNEFAVMLSGDGTATYRRFAYIPSISIADGAWHHLAFTWNSGTLQMYIDGRQRTPTYVVNDSFTTVYNPTIALLIGAVNTSNPAGIPTGQIDDVRIYRRLMAPAEVSWAYRDSLSLRYEMVRQPRARVLNSYYEPPTGTCVPWHVLLQRAV